MWDSYQKDVIGAEARSIRPITVRMNSFPPSANAVEVSTMWPTIALGASSLLSAGGAEVRTTTKNTALTGYLLPLSLSQNAIPARGTTAAQNHREAYRRIDRGCHNSVVCFCRGDSTISDRHRVAGVNCIGYSKRNEQMASTPVGLWGRAGFGGPQPRMVYKEPRHQRLVLGGSGPGTFLCKYSCGVNPDFSRE